MPNYFSGPTLKLESVFQLGRKRKIGTFHSTHPSLPFSEMAALEAAMQNRSLVQRQAPSSCPVTRSLPPACERRRYPPAFCAALAPTSSNRCSGGCPGTAKEMLSRSPTHWIPSAPTPSHILPGSEVIDICVSFGPRRCGASLHNQRCPSAKSSSSSAANPFPALCLLA